MRAACLVILAWAVIATAGRNYVWTTQETLWRDTVSKSPLKERPRHALGGALLIEGRYQQSLNADMDAIQVLPYPHSEFYQRSGMSLMRLGRWDEAHAMFHRAIRRQRSSQAWMNLGASYLQRYFTMTPYQKKREWLWLAQDAYAESLMADAGNEWALDGFIDASFYASRELGASMQRYFYEVDRPLDYEEVYALAKLSLNAGFYAQAEGLFAAMHQTRRESMPGHIYHAVALQKLNRVQEAIEQYNAALRLDPMQPAVREAIEELTVH